MMASALLACRNVDLVDMDTMRAVKCCLVLCSVDECCPKIGLIMTFRSFFKHISCCSNTNSTVWFGY